MNVKNKCIIFIVLYIFILLILPFVFQDKKVVISQIEKVISPYIADEFIKQDDKDIYKKYNLKEDVFKDYISYVNASFMDVEEFTIFEVSDKKMQDNVIRNLNKYCEAKKKTFVGYGPKQVNLIDNRIIKKKGDFVFLIIIDNNKQIWKKIDKLF